MVVKRYRLACGCEPGFFACLKAQELWKNTLDLMRIKGTKDEEYLKAREEYDRHTEDTESAQEVRESPTTKKVKGFNVLEYD